MKWPRQHIFLDLSRKRGAVESVPGRGLSCGKERTGPLVRKAKVITQRGGKTSITVKTEISKAETREENDTE